MQAWGSGIYWVSVEAGGPWRTILLPAIAVSSRAPRPAALHHPLRSTSRAFKVHLVRQRWATARLSGTEHARERKLQEDDTL